MNKKFLLLVLLGVFFMITIPAFYLASVGQPSLLALFICASAFGIFLILPLVLTVYNLIYCFRDWDVCVCACACTCVCVQVHVCAGT